jgi:hypothetical protein
MISPLDAAALTADRIDADATLAVLSRWDGSGVNLDAVEEIGADDTAAVRIDADSE